MITIRFHLSKNVPPNTDSDGRFNRAPDEEELDAMLSYIGEHLGMSEWGHAYKFGRFELRPPKTNNDEQTTKGVDPSKSTEGGTE